MGKLARKVEDIDSLGFMMGECSIDIEINPFYRGFTILLLASRT